MAPFAEKWSLYWLARNRPWVLVVMSGLLMAASFPPSPLAPLSFLGFVPLFILVEATPEVVVEDKLFLPLKKFWVIFFRLLTFQFIWRRNVPVFKYERKQISGNAQIFRYTYFAFFIWNLLCCYWLSLTVMAAESLMDGIARMSAGVLAITLNPVLMSIPWQFYSRIRKIVSPVAAAACLGIFWITFEFLHFRWELSWSWLTLGHSLSASPSLVQYTEFTGVLGASLYILVANLLIYSLVRKLHERRKGYYPLAATATGWILLPLFLNLFILNPSRAVFQPSGTLNVRVIQPNIPPEEKFTAMSINDQMKMFLGMSFGRGVDSLDLVLLPETALPIPMDSNEVSESRLMRPFWQLADSYDVDVLSGCIEERFFFPPQEIPVSANLWNEKKGIYRDTYNAAVMISPGKSPVFYEKTKMVPMVERVPFLEAFHWLKNVGMDMGTGIGGYGLPDSLMVLKLSNGIPVAVMICYESEFGDFARQQTLKGAQLLTVITNDGWWQQSSGYIQHSYLSVLRSIENRRDLARSANTGRSMFVNSKGEISQPTSWWVPAVIDQKLNLYTELTFYVRHGDLIGKFCLWLSVLITLGGIAWARLRPQEN